MNNKQAVGTDITYFFRGATGPKVQDSGKWLGAPKVHHLRSGRLPKCPRPPRWLPGPLRARNWRLPAALPASSSAPNGLATEPRPASATPARSVAANVAWRALILPRCLPNQSCSCFLVAAASSRSIPAQLEGCLQPRCSSMHTNTPTKHVVGK